MKSWDVGVLGQRVVDEEVFNMAKKFMTDVQYKVPIVSAKPKDLGNACHNFSSFFVLIRVAAQGSGSTTRAM